MHDIHCSDWSIEKKGLLKAAKCSCRTHGGSFGVVSVDVFCLVKNLHFVFQSIGSSVSHDWTAALRLLSVVQHCKM